MKLCHLLGVARFKDEETDRPFVTLIHIDLADKMNYLNAFTAKFAALGHQVHVANILEITENEKKIILNWLRNSNQNVKKSQ